MTGLETKAGKSHEPGHQREVNEVRAVLRAKGYLQNPTQEAEHVSLGNKPLDIELKDFAGTCKLNREIYLDELAAGIITYLKITIFK